MYHSIMVEDSIDYSCRYHMEETETKTGSKMQ